MSRSDHFEILGITNARVGPFGLLGVSPEDCDRATVLRALEAQLARIEAHPDVDSDKAGSLRFELAVAADLLLDPDTLDELRREHYGTTSAMQLPAASPPASTGTMRRPGRPDRPDLPPGSVVGGSSLGGISGSRQSDDAPIELADDDEIDGRTAKAPMGGKVAPSRVPTAKARPAPATSPLQPAPPGRPPATAPVGRRAQAQRPATRSGRDGQSRSGRPVSGVRAVAEPEQLTPLQCRIATALIASGGWNARARRRIMAAASESNLSSEMLMGEILRVATCDFAFRPERSAAGPDLERAPQARRRGQNPSLAPDSLSSEGVGLARCGASLEGEAGGDGEALAGLGAASYAQSATQVPSAKEAADEARIAARNLRVAVSTFIVGGFLTIPFAIWVLVQMASVPKMPFDLPTLSGSEVSSVPVPAFNPLLIDTPAPQRPRTPIAALSLTFSGAIDQLLKDMYATEGLPIDLLDRFARLVDQSRRSWVRFDHSSRNRIQQMVVSSFFEKALAESDAARLLDAIDPPGRSTAETGEDVHANAWTLGMLTVLAAEPNLPAGAAKQIDARLRDRLGGVRPATGVDFDTAALRALSMMTGDLVKATGRQESSVELWMAWGEAVASLTNDADSRTTLLLDAGARLLISGPDLTVSAPARIALVGILSGIDWPSSMIARRRFLAWYDDPRITAEELSVVSSYLVANGKVPGLDESFILPGDASAEQRARAREQLATAWALADGTSGGAVSGDIADWIARAQRAVELLRSEGPDSQLNQILLLARINEAAFLLGSNQTEQARRTLLGSLRESEMLAEGRALPGFPSAPVSSKPTVADTGGSRDRDGQFALQFFDMTKENDRAGRADLLRNLVPDSSGDLGPIDGGVLANIALGLWDQPRELRLLALDIVRTRFSHGALVILRVADGIPPERSDRPLSDMIQAVTGQTLPDPRSDRWYPQARLALLRHVVRLRGITGQNRRFDAMAQLIASSYAVRAGRSTEYEGGDPPKDPAEAALACYGYWLDQARPMMPVTPVPGTLADVVRRTATRLSLYDDPVGRFAAAQLGVLDAAVYVSAAERPELRLELRKVIDDATAARASARTVLEQIIEAERAIVRVWMIRLGHTGV